MRPSASAFLVLASASLLAAFAACTPDHDLAPTTSSTGTGGTGGGGAGGATSTGATGGSTTTTTTPEPAGPTKLTILNGINDYDAIRVCFVPYPSGPKVSPWPSSASGLAFSKAMQVDPPTSIAPGGADVQPYVLAGDLSAIAGMSCDEALALAASGGGGAGTGGAGAGGAGAGAGGAGVGGSGVGAGGAGAAGSGAGGAGAGGAGGAGAGGAGAGGTGAGGSGAGAGGSGAGGAPGMPPPIVASAMPVIPASVFEAEKSLLLVFFGCVGGPGHVDGTEGLGCGFSFTPSTPTASLTLVAMSRIVDPDRVALQFVHASSAMPISDIRVTPGLENVVDVPVAKALALGGLGPKPPFVGLARADYGVLSKVAIKTFAPNDVYATSALLLQDAFAKGGLTDSAFQNGAGFTIVAIGGYPGVTASSFWHPFTYVMLPSDPE